MASCGETALLFCVSGLQEAGRHVRQTDRAATQAGEAGASLKRHRVVSFSLFCSSLKGTLGQWEAGADGSAGSVPGPNADSR